MKKIIFALTLLLAETEAREDLGYFKVNGPELINSCVEISNIASKEAIDIFTENGENVKVKAISYKLSFKKSLSICKNVMGPKAYEGMEATGRTLLVSLKKMGHLDSKQIHTTPVEDCRLEIALFESELAITDIFYQEMSPQERKKNRMHIENIANTYDNVVTRCTAILPDKVLIEQKNITQKIIDKW